MDEFKVDGDVIAEVVAYLNGHKTAPAQRMADAVLRLLNRHYQDAAALEAAREDAERWEFARKNWHRLATATMPDGNGGVVCDELFVMPAHEDDPPLIGLDAAIDQARGIVPEAGQEVGNG